ncbi:carboxymuconolactone decarboxylase family protein [Thermoflavifilum thermophilum]|uniref:Alkylhydroperoxidase AhpD family core domain-containing protein n=1 Tax=Thermoflavifilum thermophilum TaxID=1393122 RepID=A0A1I7NCP1_9BACT|nr:carboxymuconolactone decarboxylase family protein [Thermoflavifilum thermophilum]SFV32430.1 alkylhydroperoxidase AhpD family core domain-containing protein [Thermoflavifilum thermophilum]
MFSQRMDLPSLAPEAYEAMRGLEAYIRQSGLDRRLYELIKIRASQINGCVFCLNMHTREARALGETEQRIYALNAWQEAPYYTEKERAALALTEAITRVAETRVPDEVFEAARQHFDEKELAALIIGITTINAWNRLAIATRIPPKD